MEARGEERRGVVQAPVSVKTIQTLLTLTYRGARMAVWYGHGSG